MQITRWGIIGNGNIATTFAKALQALEDAQLVAVCSRTITGARAFAESFAMQGAYDDLEEMLAKHQLDAVYIGSPHPAHFAQAQACLTRNIAVLCEKPVALNASQAQQLSELAQAQQTLFVEAMMIPHLPAIAQLLQLIRDGVLGKVLSVDASMGFAASRDMQNRVFNPQLGGGALLDVGIYPLTLAHLVAQAAGYQQLSALSSSVIKAPTGVDERSTINLRYDEQLLITLQNSVSHYQPCVARIYGDKAIAEIEHFSYAPTQIRIFNPYAQEQTPLLFEVPEAYQLEAQHFMWCLREGKLQSPLVPQQQTVAIMAIMDRLRADWGLVYPQEL